MSSLYLFASHILERGSNSKKSYLRNTLFSMYTVLAPHSCHSPVALPDPRTGVLKWSTAEHRWKGSGSGGGSRFPCSWCLGLNLWENLNYQACYFKTKNYFLTDRLITVDTRATNKAKHIWAKQGWWTRVHDLSRSIWVTTKVWTPAWCV